MREELVRRRCWVSEQQFLDLLGATNLIPGPNSTGMAIHLGYVRAGWLTDQQLLDAISIGQVTPGPVLTTATFIGCVLGGWPAALLATVAIFLPAFVFVALSGPVIPRLRRWRWTAALLEGVNVAALALMAAVTWQLARAALGLLALAIFGA